MSKSYLINIFLAVFDFLIAKIVTRKQQLYMYQAGYIYLLYFFIYKNCNAEATITNVLGWLQIFVFAILLIKIVIRKQQL